MSPRLISVAAGVLALVGAVVVSSFATTDRLVLVAVGTITALQWWALQRATGQPVPFPALPVAGLNIVGVFGWLYYPSISATAAVSARLPETPDVYSLSAQIFGGASLSIFAGGTLSAMRGSGTRLSATAASREAARLLGSIRPSRLMAITTLPLIAITIAYSPSGLLQRDHYGIVTAPGIVVRAAQVGLPIGIALVSMSFMATKGKPARVVAAPLLVAFILVTFSTGSRILMMFPGMLMLAWLARPGTRSRAATLSGAIAAGVCSILLLQLPLTMRQFSAGAGFFPYSSLIFSDPAILLRVDLAKICGNVLFSVPLTAVTAQLPEFPRTWLLTSINPLLGGMTDWPAISGNLRLNAYTPTSGLGELSNYGPVILVGYLVTVGFVLGRAQQWISRMAWTAASVATVLGLGLTGSFTSHVMQYNLRTASRDIWYLLAGIFILHIVGRSRESFTALPAGSAEQDGADGPVEIGSGSWRMAESGLPAPVGRKTERV